jgi:hypothetical protein
MFLHSDIALDWHLDIYSISLKFINYTLQAFVIDFEGNHYSMNYLHGGEKYLALLNKALRKKLKKYII